MFYIVYFYMFHYLLYVNFEVEIVAMFKIVPKECSISPLFIVLNNIIIISMQISFRLATFVVVLDDGNIAVEFDTIVGLTGAVVEFITM